MKDLEYDFQEKVHATHWWHVGRRILLEKMLNAYGDVLGGGDGTIYDIGCGVGENYPIYHKYFKHIIGVDASRKALDFASAKGFEEVVCSTLEGLPQPHRSNVADVIVMMDVLEHLEDDGKGVNMIFGMLKPGGAAIVTVPAFMVLWGLQDEVSLHFRRYRMKKLRDLFKAKGFEIRYSTYFNTFLFIPILIVRLLMRAFKVKVFKSESQMNSPLLNSACSLIFKIEIKILNLIKSYPFGVSALLVVRKPYLES